MKRIVLLSLSFLFFSLISFSQNVLTPALQHEMHERSGENLDVVVYLQDDFDLMAFHQRMKVEKAGKDQRVRAIQNELQSVARTTQDVFQSELLALSQRGYSQVNWVNAFWIVNAVQLNVPASYLDEIAAIPMVKRIDINSARYSFENPVKVESADAKAEGGIEPGLAAINAPAIWEMGYTGRNLLFLSMDTGVFPDHPAISNRFLGNHRPLNQVWYGVRSEVPSDHASSSHGTHTTGTVLGLVPETNDTIGVAYTSYWIASDPVASSESDLLTPTDFMDVFEWVLNPDGDETTTDDVPDVINNSWGYDYTLALEFDACNMEEAEILEVIEAAGILSPFSAGNEGPVAFSTGFPAMLAFSELNVMSVGALNGNTDSYPIADFSSRGPTPCVETGGALEIKPEVSAPGVSVRSCSGHDEFSLLSGTSMACPHVSGALLLLKEAYPFLDAVALKEALYETAIDLGDPGEDNVYGRGMIDVLAAYNYLDMTYDPVPPVTDSFDVKLEIRQFSGNFVCPGNEAVTPQIALMNTGQENLTFIDYAWSLNGSDAVSATWTGELTAGEEVLISLDEVNLVQGKNSYYATADPDLTSREFNIYNNSDIATAYVIETAEYPFADNFEDYTGHIPNGSWYVENPDGGYGWELVDAPSTDAENQALSVQFYSYVPRDFQEDAIYSSLISLPDIEEQLNLSFDIAYKKRLETFYNDSLIVLMSTDCGGNFDHVLFRSGGPDLTTVEGNTNLVSWVPESAVDWDTVNVNLSAFAGQDVMFKFLTKNDRGNNLYLDNIRLYSGNADAISSQVKSDLVFYPNPAKQQVFVEHELKGEVKYSIISVDGKTIKTDVLNDANSIDLQGISAGLYVVKLYNRHELKVASLLVN